MSKRLWNTVIGLMLGIGLVGCTAKREPTFESESNALEQEAYEVNLRLVKVKKQLQSLTPVFEAVHIYPDSLMPAVPEDLQAFLESTSGPRSIATTDSIAAWVYDTLPTGDSAWQEAYLASALDTQMMKVMRGNPNIDQLYFISNQGWMRVFPFLDTDVLKLDTLDVFRAKTFFLPEEKIDPDKFYWNETPYLDPLGRGWVVSCAVPVFFDSLHYGWMGMDLSLQQINTGILGTEHQDRMLVNQKGMLIASGDEAAKYTSVQAIPKHTYLGGPRFQQEPSNKYYIYTSKNEEVRNIMQGVLFNERKKGNFTWNGTSYMLIATDVTELDWKLLRIFPVKN